MALDRGIIATEALALIDAEGLAALSARRLAKALGCEAMSLYHHFPNMAALQDAVADRLLAAVTPPDGALGWSAIATFIDQYLTLAERHPNAFPLIATRPWRSPTAGALAASLGRAVGILTPEPKLAARRVRVIRAYLDGAGLALAAWSAAPEDDRGSRDTLRADLDAGILQLTAPMRARLGSRTI